VDNATTITTNTRKATSTTAKSDSPSQLIDARIKELDDWRGKMLAQIRKVIKQADPDVVEEWKWRRVPVWSANTVQSAHHPAPSLRVSQRQSRTGQTGQKRERRLG
jgi:hypothetical protein